MTAMHRLLATQHGVDLPTGKDAEYEAKRARAMKWLEKNERDLDLAVEATGAMGRVTPDPPPDTKPARVRRKCSLDDVSDDNDWSAVRLESQPGAFGSTYPINGFIYPTGG